MELKTYQARSMSEALARVKGDLGPDAVILHTRTVRQGGVLGIGARTLVEITATDEPRPLGAPRPLEEPRPSGRAALYPPAAPTIPADPPGDLVSAYTELVAHGVAQFIREEIIERAGAHLAEGATPTDADIRAALARYVVEMLPPAEQLQFVAEDRPTIVALVGPTGVGKTTTAAKLAAQAKVRHGRRVALVTVDCRRIGAVQQLEAYARILDIPLVSVASPEEVIPAIQRLADYDLILIDTPGSNQNDDAALRKLEALLRPARPDHVQLVLSAAAGERVLRRAVERFSTLGATKIIFTKLDESVGFGVILNVLRSFDLPLSYITTGPSVPQDIAEGSVRLVADLLLGTSR